MNNQQKGQFQQEQLLQERIHFNLTFIWIIRVQWTK